MIWPVESKKSPCVRMRRGEASPPEAMPGVVRIDVFGVPAPQAATVIVRINGTAVGSTVFGFPACKSQVATPVFVAAVEQLATQAPLPPLTYGALHRAVQPFLHAVAQSSETGWLRPLLRDASEMDIDRSRARKAAHKQAAADDRERRVAGKREFLASRRRERQRHQWVGARRKQLSRIKGRLKGLVGSSS